MLLFEYLGRDLAEVHYLCFTAFAVDIVSGIGEAVAVVLVGEIVINVEIVLGSRPLLLYSEQQIQPLPHCCRTFLALQHLSHLGDEEVGIRRRPGRQLHMVHDLPTLRLAQMQPLTVEQTFREVVEFRNQLAHV